MTTKRWTQGLFAVVLVAAISACGGPPDDAHMQWVARDAWDPTCADQAIVEQWRTENGAWKVKDEVWATDVKATFKLVNPCKSGLPLVGKSYAQFETVKVDQRVEMSKCKKNDTTGWALPGKEASRCWIGPRLLP